MHAARELVFAAIFGSLAWAEWHGSLAWWVAALFLAEVLVSARDVVIEGETRILPVPERILHLFLFMNLGALIVLVGGVLPAWSAAPSGLAHVDFGWASWTLAVFALLSFCWAVRDGVNALQRVRLGEAA
jgi:hypothetical protein